jgi:uncharacterized protein (DUF885 family)
MRPRTFASSFVVIFAIGACANEAPAPKVAPAPPATAAPTPSTTASAPATQEAPSFDAVAYRTAIETSLEALFAGEPHFATSVGDHRFDDQWPDLDAKAEEKLHQDYEVRAQGLRTIAEHSPDRADPAEAGTDRPRLDALLLADRLEGIAKRAEILKPYERDPSAVLMLIGFGISRIISHEYAPKHARMNALETRIAKIPALLETARGRLGTPSRAGLENAAIVAPGLARLLREEISRQDAKQLDGDAPLAERLKAGSLAAAVAIEDYAKDVARSYPLDKAKNDPIGADKWATLARLFEGLADSPVDVRKMGEAEIARLTNELDELVAKSGRPGESRAQFLERLTKEGTVAPEKVLDEYRAANKGVEAWMRANKFATVPWEKAKLEIVPSPPHMRGISFASMNAAGALDAHISTARFEVNVPDAKTPALQRAALLAFHAKGATENISLHEAIPGHYLQVLWQRQSPSKVRKVLWASTFGEGWAHYCEQAVLDAGFAGADPVRTKAFYLRSALQRAARVVVDVGESDGSLTAEQGQKLLEEHAMLAPDAARIEARRALVWPANMFTYTYGKLKIVELLRKAKEREKDRFDLVSFHDRMLAVGAVPIRYMGPAAFGEVDQKR